MLKVIGENPGKDRILAYIDQLNQTSPATSNGVNLNLGSWYKAILAVEAGPGAPAYAPHQAWDQFERVTETVPGVGRRRNVPAKVNGVKQRFHYDVRYGFPFVTYDNGWGIAQLTGGEYSWLEVAPWQNNVRRGWELLKVKVLTGAAYLQQISGLGLGEIPQDIVINEGVRRYNGQVEYSWNGTSFVSDPNLHPRNPQYLSRVTAKKSAEGY